MNIKVIHHGEQIITFSYIIIMKTLHVDAFSSGLSNKVWESAGMEKRF